MMSSGGVEPYDLLVAFIAEAPLYKRFDLGQLWEESSLRLLASVINMPKVYRYCDHSRCRTERPFDRMGGDDPGGWAFHEEPGLNVEPGLEVPGRITGRVYALTFLCTGCNVSVFQCWIEADPQYEQPGKKHIRKVGQTPPWDISIDKSLRDAFGEDAGLYKDARECMSHSYGVASCAYLRRILENRVLLLLQTLRELREAEGATSEDLSEIDAAIRRREAEDRIRLANEALPESIKIAGDNPLALIYDRLSDALHRRDDQDCMDIAENVSKPLEHIVTSLSAARRQLRERKAYEEQIGVLRKGPGLPT